MRPALKAGLLPLWRDRDTLQFQLRSAPVGRRCGAVARAGGGAVTSLLQISWDPDELIGPVHTVWESLAQAACRFSDPAGRGGRA